MAVLEAAGYGVLSEESGRHGAERSVTVVVDPSDYAELLVRRASAGEPARHGRVTDAGVRPAPGRSGASARESYPQEAITSGWTHSG